MAAVAGTRRETLPIIFCMLSIFVSWRLINAPADIETKPIDLPAPVEFPFNNVLNLSHVSLMWQVRGPESFALGPDRWIYSGTADGRIIKFDPKTRQPKDVAQIGVSKPECGSYLGEPECGRPLGVRFNADGQLIVADGYYGLLQVDVNTGRSQVLADGVDGKKFVFLNGLVTDAPDGNYYITESSTRRSRRDVALEVVETNPSGRLLKYDPRTKQVTVLLTGLYFPNGMTLSHDKTELLICLWSKMQVVAYSLANAQLRVVAENLPGPPDNITPRSNGQSYWIGLSYYRNPRISVMDMLAQLPTVRYFSAKLFNHHWFMSLFAPRTGFIVELSEGGQIVSSLQDHTGYVFYLSEAFEHDGFLYMGSFVNPFLCVAPVSMAVPIAAQ